MYVLKPWAQAYSNEKAKNFARKEDLAEILAEVRAVTITQKEIEARISGDIWDRQWRLNQKRDVYAKVIEGLSEAETTIGAYANLLKTNRLDRASDIQQLQDRSQQILLDLERARAVARIYLSPDAIAAIDRFEKEVKENSADYGAICRIFSEATERLIAAAKRDLGTG
jgi:hypothetical protein